MPLQLSTPQLLNHLKARLGVESNYALAKRLVVSASSVRNWYEGSTHPDDQICIAIAQLMGVEPAQVLAMVQANRQKYSPAAHVWSEIFETVHAHLSAQGRRVL